MRNDELKRMIESIKRMKDGEIDIKVLHTILAELYERIIRLENISK